MEPVTAFVTVFVATHRRNTANPAKLTANDAFSLVRKDLQPPTHLDI
jgi:hypothetical protein